MALNNVWKIEKYKIYKTWKIKYSKKCTGSKIRNILKLYRKHRVRFENSKTLFLLFLVQIKGWYALYRIEETKLQSVPYCKSTTYNQQHRRAAPPKKNTQSENRRNLIGRHDQVQVPKKIKTVFKRSLLKHESPKIESKLRVSHRGEPPGWLSSLDPSNETT